MEDVNSDFNHSELVKLVPKNQRINGFVLGNINWFYEITDEKRQVVHRTTGLSQKEAYTKMIKKLKPLKEE